MLSNLMVGAQIGVTHCEYHELQLEPSAFHAVHMYSTADAEAGVSAQDSGNGQSENTNSYGASGNPHPEPLAMTALFGLNLFGLGVPPIQRSEPGALPPAPADSGDAHETSAGGGETEGDDLLVTGAVEMA